MERLKGFVNSSLDRVERNHKTIIRGVLTLLYYAILFFVLRLLFKRTIHETNAEALDIVIGAIVASFGKVTDYWFHYNQDGSSCKKTKEKEEE